MPRPPSAPARRGSAIGRSSSGGSPSSARRSPRWPGRTPLKRVAERLERRAKAISAGEGDGDGEVAAELRECSQQEFGLQGELREASEAMTVAEVEATQLRGRRDESAAELERLGSALGETLSAATEPLSDQDRERIEARLARLERNRERIGPVNPG